MSRSRTVCEINGDFSRKSPNFPTTHQRYLSPLLKGFPSECRRLGSKKTRIMGLPGRQRSLTVSSAVWMQYQRDGQTDTGRQQRPRMCTASRSKKRNLVNLTRGLSFQSEVQWMKRDSSNYMWWRMRSDTFVVCYYTARYKRRSERSCLFVCGCVFVCGSVTTITRSCVHRSSPNWVYGWRYWQSPAD